MVLGIGKLKRSAGKWHVVYPDTVFHSDLDSMAGGGSIFMLHDDQWEEVYFGETERYAGRIFHEGKDTLYEGAAAFVKFAGQKTGKMIPTPGAPLGIWVACKAFDDEYWEMQDGLLVRIPQSMGQVEGIAGTWGMEPKGRVVCEVLWEHKPQMKKPGRVALELSRLPFPKELWFFDETGYKDSDIELYWQSEEMELTRQFYGEIDLGSMFWLL